MNWFRKFAKIIRGRFHPLHNLRKNSLYQYCLQPLMDVPIQADLGFLKPVYIRLLTHFSFLFLAREMEENALCTFSKLAAELHPDRHSVYDVGANIGLYTWCALDVNPKLSVATFEPDPRNFLLLRESARVWDAQNVHLFCKAVSDKAGVATFSQDLLSSATGTLVQTTVPFAQKYYQQKSKQILVGKTSLDHIFVNELMPPPALIKIDVEGHELEVLQGADQILAQYQPILLVESFSEHASSLQELLKSYGYIFFDADNLSKVSPSSLNYLCVVQDRLSSSVLFALKNLGYPINS